MAKVNYDEIPDIDTSWEGYAGSSVELFIKRQLFSKFGKDEVGDALTIEEIEILLGIEN